jgi:predicted dehydrogenase
MDAGIVLDLMIHDIDLILSWVPAPVIAVQAVGFNWTGPAEDIAQARLTFANGCVAHLRASRVSSEPQRQLRAYGHDWYAKVDFGDRSGFIVHGPESADWQSRSYTAEQRKRLMERVHDEVLRREELAAPEANPILDELRDFVKAVTKSESPIVSGRDGFAAVEVANQILQRITQRAPNAATYQPPRRKAG